MSSLQTSMEWPKDFSGVVRLFPLPNVVLFPQVLLPLHIFEPRYCELLADSLASDQLIAMAILAQDWEAQYDKRPPIASTVCIGKVLTHTACDSDRHNILLLGMKRARIVCERACSKMYRMADVELLEDIYPDEESLHRPCLIEKLKQLLAQCAPGKLSSFESFANLLEKQLPLGVLTDMIAFSVNLPIAIKVQLLTETNVDMRCRILTRCLEHKLYTESSSPEPSAAGRADPPRFPPEFSEN